MNKLGTVIAFTMRNKLQSKAFIITTAILLVLSLVMANAPYLINKLGGGDSASQVGYVQGQQPEIVQMVQGVYAAQAKVQAQPDVKLEMSGDEAQLKSWLEEGTLDGYITFEGNAQTGFPSVIYHSKSALGSGTSASLAGVLQQVKTELILKDAGLTAEQKNKLSMPLDFQNEQVSVANTSGKTAEEQGTAIGLMYAVIILLFMAIMISGQLIATEITAEKSSRIMEILVTSVSPLIQMFGKIIGTFIISVLQMGALIGVLVINLNLPHNAGALDSFGIRLDTIDPMLLIYAILYFLLGFFLFATVFAGLGSLVSRTEDLGQAVMPVTLTMALGFYIAMFGLTHPDSPLIVVCSFIPFFAPFLMLMRIGLSEPAWWEIALSFGILILSTLVLGWLSAKIYRTGVLMYGKRPSLKELLKAMKAYKV
jgi:ABC-2 type transport system permease protein